MNKQKTIAQQLGITKFPFEIKENGRVVYFENRAKYWVKYQYDKNGNEIRRECSDLYIGISTFNKNNQLIRFEDSKGYWQERGYDKNGVQNYYANSHGVVDDNRKPVKKVEVKISITIKNGK
jgi:hypothetical protein